MAHLCADCEYEYPETEFQATPSEQRLCPECGSTRVNAQVHAQLAVGLVATVGAVSIRVTTNVWLAWMEIAIERARAARQARAETVESSSGDGMTREFHAALVAVAASAHALDALYGSTAVPASVRAIWTLTRRTSRHAKIRESLKRIFNTGPVDAKWVGEFKWLFGLRDAALHAREELHSPVAHPMGGNTPSHYVDYSTESATRAVDLALSVLRRCVDHPKPNHPDAVNWATTYRPTVEDLERRWSLP